MRAALGEGWRAIGENIEDAVRSDVGRVVTRLGAAVVVLGDRIEQSGCWTTVREMDAHREGFMAGQRDARV